MNKYKALRLYITFIRPEISEVVTPDDVISDVKLELELGEFITPDEANVIIENIEFIVSNFNEFVRITNDGSHEDIIKFMASIGFNV